MIEQATGQRLVRMELKYCEGCGGLLLRRSGDTVVYCASCQRKLAELPGVADAGVLHPSPAGESAIHGNSPAPKIPPCPAVSNPISAEPRRMA